MGVATALALAVPASALAATANPTSLAFNGATFPGGPQQQVVTFTLAALESGTVTFTGTNPTDFSASPTSCPMGGLTGSECAVTVTFTPQAAGARSATLVLTPSLSAPVNVPLTGTTAPAATLAATGLGFGAAQTGTKTAGQATTIRNTGNAPLTISSITLGGANPDQFQLGYCFTLPLTLQAGQECAVGAVFAPTSAGDKSAAIVITDDAAGSPHTVALSGTGVAPPPPPPTGNPPPPTTVDVPGGGSTVTGAPKIAISTPKRNATVTRTYKRRVKGKLKTLTKAVTFKGTASDNDGLARVEVALVKGAKAPASPKFTRGKLDDFTWSYALSTKTKLAAGTYTLVARATDLKGVRSDIVSVTFKIK